MNVTRAACLAILSASWYVGAARAADRAVTITRPAPLAKGVDAMPLIDNPTDDAERRINTAVERLDATIRKAMLDCKKQAGPAGFDWSRSVTVAMAGPRYLSFVIADDSFCGGAHPDEGTMSIVYDLRTGRPVDWTTLLPSALTGKVALEPGMDGTQMVTLTSPRLHELYMKGYDRAAAGGDAECHETVDSASDTPSMVWLDAKQGGLVVQFDLAHVVQACAIPVVIPTAVLRTEGADAGLVDAIETAHRKP